jgi:ribosomal protein S27E
MGLLSEGKCPLCVHGRVVYDKRLGKMRCNDCGEKFSP